MNPVTKKTIVIISVVALIGTGAWLYLWKLTDEYIRSDEEKGITIKALEFHLQQATDQNSRYHVLFDRLADTIMGLKVEKGQVEIELNRKTEEIKQANARYKSSRQVKDTGRALLICDSIVYTYLPEYFRIDSSQNWYVDTLQTFTDKWITQLADTTIKVSDQLIENIGTQIDERTEDKKENKKQGKRRKGELLKAGIFGAAIGVLLSLIFGG